MSRLLLPVVVGFALGLGGATGMVVAREREVQAAARTPASPPADSLAQAAAAEDSATAAPPSPGLDAVRDSLARVDSLALAAAAESLPPAAVEAASPAPALEGGRLAKIFGAMQPREAARVLEQMDDADVQVLLAALGDRKAAAILAQLPPQRAAAIGSTVLRGGKETP